MTEYTPRGQSRAAVVAGDPFRSEVVVWSRAGGLTPAAVYPDWHQGTYVLAGPAGKTLTLPRTQPTFANGILNWLTQYYGAVVLPADTPPGEWTIDAGTGPLWTVTVVAPPPAREFVRVAAGNSRAAVQGAVSAGMNVELAAGLHVWDHVLRMDFAPEGVTIRGHNATVQRVDDGDYNNRFFYGGNYVTVEGVTFIGGRVDAADWYSQVLHADPPANGVGWVFSQCAFRYCNFGYNALDVVVQDCDFYEAGCFIAPPGLYRRCVFRGRGRPDPWQPWYGDGTHALVSCQFHGTNRGPIFGTHWGAFSNNLIIDTKVSMVTGEENSGESLMCEGANAFDNNLIIVTRVTAGSGTAVSLDTPARNNLVYDLQAEGANSILLWDHTITGNEFAKIELRGGGIVAHGGTGNTFRNVALLNFTPFTGNQSSEGQGYYRDPWRRTAFYSAKTNRLEQATAVRLGEFTLASPTVSLSDVWAAGKAVPDVKPKPVAAGAPPPRRRARTPADYGMPATLAEYREAAERPKGVSP